MSSDLAYLPATTLAALFRARELSPVALTETLLARIEASQPSLNAFITIDHAGARAAAKAAEQRMMSGTALSLLDGVPYSVKDLTFTTGLRTTMGSRVMQDFVPKEDAFPVARMRAAGNDGQAHERNERTCGIDPSC